MTRIRGWLKQLRALLRKDTVEAELDDELAYHIDRETEHNLASGMTPGEARRAALVAFRGVERYKEEVRDARWTRVLEDATADARLALRSIRRRPGFAAAAVLTLALGIGGTTAVYSVLRSVLFEPLPYPESERLVRLYQFDVDDPSQDQYVSAVHFREYRDNASFFEAVGSVYTYDETGADLLVGGLPERVRVLSVSPGYFRVLRAVPVAGRAFMAEEDRGQPVAAISDALSRRLVEGGEPGGTIELDGAIHTVVGVMPAGWRDPLVGSVDVWVPADLYTGGAQYPGNHYLSMIARLGPGVTLDRARVESAALDRRLAEIYPDVADDGGFKLRPLREDMVAAARPTLILLMAATSLVLLIACVNVANLQMVRSLGRTRETAVRAAMGAGHGRIARQALTESLLLAVLGGAIGVGIARVGLDVLLAVGGNAVPRASEVGLDGSVLLFAAALTIGTGVAFGLLPAVRLALTPPAETLRDSTRGASPGRRFARVRSLLVAGQVALALVLLASAGALAASMYRLTRVELGFRSDSILAFELSLPAARYDGPARERFHRELTDRLRGLPGIRSAAAVSWPPAGGSAYTWGTHADTGPLAAAEDEPMTRVPALHRVVAGDYFATLEIPLLEGRVFDDRDGPDEAPAAVISRSVAERLFPGTSAVGHQIHGGGQVRDVIGVVEDVAGTVEGDPSPMVYHFHRQYASREWPMTYLVATEAAALAMLPEVRRIVAAADPLLVVHRPTSLSAMLAEARGRRSFAFVLTTVFAGLALVLSLVGLYGVLAHLVGQRTREIGIRIALGAARGTVAGDVVRRGLAMTAAGLVVGIAAAVGTGRLIESLVFRTEPADPLILAGAAAALTFAALAAAAVPALRAARVAPTSALAEE